MERADGGSLWARYVAATDAAKAAWQKKAAEQEEATMAAERARYENDPVGALRQDRRGWIIGETIYAGVGIGGTTGAIILENAGAKGVGGLIFVAAVGLAGTIYAEYGRFRTNRRLKTHLRAETNDSQTPSENPQ